MGPLWVSAAWAWNPTVTCGTTPATWPGTTHWRISDSHGPPQRFSPGLEDADVLDAVTAGFDAWTAPQGCCTGFEHHYDGVTTATGHASGDGLNTISFEHDPTAWDPANNPNVVIAITRIAWLQPGCAITEADQVYNAFTFDFSVGAGPGPGQTDLQSIATHEHGHWAGIGHTPDVNATMYASYSGGIGPRTLAQDDADAICALYPDCGPDEDCADGLDNDADGLTDCEDPDCAAFPACVCAEPLELPCNTPVSGTTVGGPRSVDAWACTSWQNTGPEAVYRVVPPGTGPATIQLTGLTADLDLVVTQGTHPDRCDPQACIASGQPDTSDESITVELVGGTPYYVVADGFNGASSAFTLFVDCPGWEPPAEEPVEPTEPPDDTAAPLGPTTPRAELPQLEGCGCRAPIAAAPWPGVLALLLSLTRRRRTTPRGRPRRTPTR